mmetsp:Transcript_2758/g.7119  ORF Transcript_2758/g.7119 Transcript_2758/m.7119 type:complete len:363 (-) Transcript_2758:2110-3198(-)
MHSLLRQGSAILAVEGVRGHRTDHVGRVDVFDRHRDAAPLEMLSEFILEVGTDIRQLCVAACVFLARAFDDGVPAALSDYDHCILLPAHDVRHIGEQLVLRDLHLGNQADVDILRCYRCHGRDPSAVPAHELHQADAVGVGRRLHVRRVNGLFCLRTCGVESKAPVEQLDVVVDGLWYAYYSALVADLRHRLEGSHGTLVRPVPAQNEELPDIPLAHHLGNALVWRVATVTHQDAPSAHVDVLHRLWRQVDPVLLLVKALVSATNAVDGLDPIRVQHQGKLTDDIVEARAQATAGDHRRSHVRLRRVEMQGLPRTSALQLQVRNRRVAGLLVLQRLQAEGAELHECGAGAASKRRTLQRALR